MAEEGTLSSVLSWIDRPGQVVRNLLSGNVLSAGRQGAQFLSDIPDAVLPGDWIPDIVQEGDDISGSELVGLEDAPWWLKTPADIGIGMATDPLSYLTFGASGAAAAGAKALGSVGKLGRASGLADDAAEVVARQAARELRSPPSLQPSPMMLGGDNLMRATPDQLRYQQLSGELSGLRKTRRGMDRPPSDQSTLSGLQPSASQYDRAGLDTAIRDTRQSQLSMLKETRGGARETFGATKARKAQEEALSSIIGSQITAEGRRRLKKQGIQIDSYIDDIAKELGGDFTEEGLRRVMQSRPDVFAQGGLSWSRLGGLNPMGGKRFKFADTAASAVRAGAKEGVTLLPPVAQKWLKKSAQTAKGWGESISETLNWTKPNAATASMLKNAMTAGANEGAYNLKNVGTIFTKINDETDMVIAQAIDNLAYADGKVTGLLRDKAVEGVDESILNLTQLRTAGLSDVDLSKVDWNRAEDVIRRLNDHNKSSWDRLREARAVGQSGDESLNVALGGAALSNSGRQSFLHRSYSGKMLDETGDIVKSFDDFDADAVSRLHGNPKTVKARTVEDVKNMLMSNPDMALERSAFLRSAGHAEQTAGIISQSKLAQEILRDGTSMLGDSAGQVAAVLNRFAQSDPAMAKLLRNAQAGFGKRNPVMKAFAKVNRVFKPAAVYGLFVPRQAALTRNSIGGVWQAWSAGGYDLAGGTFKDVLSALPESVAVALQKTMGWDVAAKSKMRKDLMALESFAELPPGQAILAATKHDPHMADAMREGVFDTFVRAEDMLRTVSRSSKINKAVDFMDAPATMFQYLESAMRWGMYKRLREAGQTSGAAAKMIQDSFLDYSVTSSKNRTLRDLIPFASFISQSIPQQAKFLTENPAVAVGLAQVYGTEEDEVLPSWIANQPHLRMGENTEGDPIYASGLGLPVEALNTIPDLSGGIRDFGKSVRQNIVGSAHPLIKAGYGYLTGSDAFFGGTYGSYSKTPEVFQALGADPSSETARMYHEASNIGLLQPFNTPINMASRALDDRMSVGDRALNLLTGLRMTSVNQDAATLSNIQEQLSTDPNVKTFKSYRGGSEESEAMIKELRAAQKALRAKRKAKEAAKAAIE